MNEARNDHSAVQVKSGVIYVCGGHDGEKYINSIEFYCDTDKYWKLITTDEDYFKPRAFAGMIGINNGNDVMILGGMDKWGYTLKDTFTISTIPADDVKLWQKEDMGAGVAPTMYPVMHLNNQIKVFADYINNKVYSMNTTTKKAETIADLKKIKDKAAEEKRHLPVEPPRIQAGLY